MADGLLTRAALPADAPLPAGAPLPAESGPPVRRPMAALALPLLRGTRPRQWVKGGLVAAAPLAAGSWTREAVLLGTLLAFLACTLTAAGSYLINDVQDATRDRAHPVKRRRPVAAGELPAGVAVVVGGVLVCAGPLVALAFGRYELAALVAGYAALTTAYSSALKALPVVEMLVVTAGFVIRPLAGAAASGVQPSAWFLAAICCGALMVVTGKRLAELRLPTPEVHRRVLARYRPALVTAGRHVAAAGLLGCYLGWAATRRRAELPTAVASTVAVLLAVIRYSLLADRGRAGQPERLLMKDRLLALCALVWLASFLVLPLE
jgi:decaprenyl-phosphate phosphoribosyltransferase